MALRDLPVRQDLLTARQTQDGHPPTVAPGRSILARGERLGAAVERPRDAYRDVPILKRPTWSYEIAAYFFFGGISSGVYTLGTLAMLGGDRWTRLGRTAHLVSLVALAPCPPLLIADLGKPARFHHMLRIFKPSSPMNLGAWTLTVHGGFAALTVMVMLARDGKLPIGGALLARAPERAMAVAGIPTALTLGGYTGVLLGTTSVPVWSTSPLLGALFMASSFSTGAAALDIAATVADGDDRRTQRVLGALGAKLGLAELALLGGYLGTSGRAAKPLLRGRHAVLLTGAIAGVALSTAAELARTRERGGGRLAGLTATAASLVGGALLRAAVVGAGGASADDRDGTLEAMGGSAGAPGWNKSEGVGTDGGR